MACAVSNDHFFIAFADIFQHSSKLARLHDVAAVGQNLLRSRRVRHWLSRGITYCTGHTGSIDAGYRSSLDVRRSVAHRHTAGK